MSEITPNPPQLPTEQQKLELCQERIAYRFTDERLLLSALTHASGASSRLLSNERLEFLGDSILGFCICESLYQLNSEFLEGELTQIKSAVVSRRACAKVCHDLRLEECLIIGRGMQSSSKLPPSLMSDLFEALIAAVYLDSGLEAARSFILRTMDAEIKQAMVNHSVGNYKSALQQRSQQEFSAAPIYRLLAEQGPDHKKLFQVYVEIKKRRFTPAWGRNKKEAEQRAAGNAMAELDNSSPPFTELF